MAQPTIQTSFHAGEWAPALNARVDLAKYQAAAALLRNFFVDYRGGASTRAGTAYVLQCFDSDNDIRLIPFQASFDVSYVLEFGNGYVRFFTDGGAVLENSFGITAATQANPCVITVVGHNFIIGDWIFISNVVGMTQLNGRYFRVNNVAGNQVTLGDLNGGNINATGYSVYSAGGNAARVYKILSPYFSSQLSMLKFAQNVDTLVLCHPEHPPYILTLIEATNWSLVPITFGSTVGAPVITSVTTTLAAGNVHFGYKVTSIDNHGQESLPSVLVGIGNIQDLRTNAGSIFVNFNAVSGATGYNVYKADPSYGTSVSTGAQFGYVGTVTASPFADSNVSPDFTTSPPVGQNPFQGSGVTSATVTNQGSGYSAVPTVTFGASPATGGTATGQAVMEIDTVGVAAGGAGYTNGDTLTFAFAGGMLLQVTALGGGNSVAAVSIINRGSLSSTLPTNPVPHDVGASGTGATFDFTWRVKAVTITNSGFGYISAPSITFSSGAAAATAVLGTEASANPTVPGYFQQRLVLAGPTINPQQFNFSQPGSFFNFNTSNPIQADDAISGSLVSGQLNTIKSLTGMSTGLVVLTDRQAWLITGAGGGAITPIDIVANTHSYNGSADVPPIIANFDILYVQAKGSIVRDLAFNFYTNTYTGTDISVLSSHLFYGHTILEWAYCEEPFKVIWAVRDDGILLSLTFLKEQELIGWAHADTDGFFHSVASITEQVNFGSVDALYMVVEREINGNVVKYIERMAERIFPNGAEDAWCVDSAISYSGPPLQNFQGAEHLAGETVTGLADGVVIPPFVMPASGFFSLGAPASRVILGKAFTCQLQTLALELGEPTSQGKRKKISAVTLRCDQTLGLAIGSTFTRLVPMKDLVVGNVGSQTNAVVTNLVTGDARTVLDPTYTTPGQYCIEQSSPLPATILGVIPEITVGDTK